MDPVPAGPFLLGPYQPTDEVIAAAVGHPGELLGIEMDQLARPIALVPSDRQSGLQPIEAGEALAAQDGLGGRGGEVCLPGEDMGSDAELATSGAERRDDRRPVTDRRPAGSTRAVGKLPDPRPPPPFRAGLPTDPGSVGCLGDRPARSDPLRQELATMRGQSSVRMRH
jgi:hypothetical protein